MRPITIFPPDQMIVTKAGITVLSWNKFAPRRWNGRYSAAQKFVDSSVLSLSEPFTPLRTGMLIKSGSLGTEIGSGTVRWVAPYAKAQYYSARKPGSTTGPLRGPAWFERMKLTHGREIIRGAKRMMNR